MRVVIQRVSRASVTIDEEITGRIGKGFMVLAGFVNEDNSEDVDWITKKIANLRIFNDENGVMNRSILEENGDILIVSQFTLNALTAKGNRPSYIKAAGHEIAIPLYNEFVEKMAKAMGKPVQTGRFGADMKVELVNDGPVTIIMDSKDKK